MKKIIITFILIIGICLLYNYRNQIIRYVMINIVYQDKLFIIDNNKYSNDNDWQYIQKTDNFYPNNEQDILNIIYTALNGGWDEVTFYCEEKYPNCLDDVKRITDQNETLSNINNFVPTFNSYKRIYFNMNQFGRVNIKFEDLYKDTDQNAISNEIDRLYNELINNNMTDRQKIKTIHDYIINNTVYDTAKANNIDINSNSTIAYGPLFNGKAICGGYTDLMALFLDKMGIKNYKISSAKHIWNFVYVDNEWKHLDLTWDDPVTPNSDNILLHTFFLISTNELNKQNTNEHIFDYNIYKEANIN